MHTGTFPLTCGAEVFTRAWKPEGAARGAVLLLHGVESHSLWFEEVGRYLAASGLIAFSFDRPGWGLSKGERGHIASYADSVRQVSEIATSLRREYGSCHLAGLSWGGLLALYAALRRFLLFDSLTLIAPGILPTADLSIWQKINVGRSFVCGDGLEQIPLPIRIDDFTHRDDRKIFIKNDEHRVTSVTASFCVETLKMRRFVRDNISRRGLPPTRLLLAGNDSIIDNRATEKLLARHSAATAKAFPDAGHSLVFEAPEKMADEISTLAESATASPRKIFTAKSADAKPRRVVVMGAGAIGSLAGGLLALGGAEVTLVGRQAHADAINENGLSLRLGHGARVIKDNLRAVTCAAEVGEADLLILSVKSFDTPDALEQARPIISKRTAILSLQNGIGNEPLISDIFPENPVFAGAICAYTEFSGAGQIAWKDDRGGIAGAIYSCGSQEREDLTRLWEELLPATGMETVFCSGENAALRVKWSKLLLNVSFNALNAVTGLPTGQILAHPDYGPLAVQALAEGVRVMGALGVEPFDLPGYPVRALAKLLRLPLSFARKILVWKTGAGESGASSMRQDLQKQRASTEIDEINGVVSRFGRERGVPTLANDKLVEMLRRAAEESR